MLSTYTPLFCFLLLRFIFYSRRALGRVMFARRAEEASGSSGLLISTRTSVRDIGLVYVRLLVASLPAVLIVGSLYAMFSYYGALATAVRSVRAQLILEAVASGESPWAPKNVMMVLGNRTPDQVEQALAILRDQNDDSTSGYSGTKGLR